MNNDKECKPEDFRKEPKMTEAKIKAKAEARADRASAAALKELQAVSQLSAAGFSGAQVEALQALFAAAK